MGCGTTFVKYTVFFANFVFAVGNHCKALLDTYLSILYFYFKRLKTENVGCVLFKTVLNLCTNT